MNFKDYMAIPGEKPLDNIPADGGFAAVFRTIGCIGDSLASGEMEIMDEEGKKHYYDLYEHSWGQYMARMLGSKCYNFSRGGMTAHVFYDSWAEENGCWDKEKASQAYIVALGVNDVSCILRDELEFGSIEDINDSSIHTFCAKYASILRRYREISPDAKFFLMTCPCMNNVDADRFKYYEKHREFLLKLAEILPNTYVLDFRRYAPVYDSEYRKNFMMGGHLNAMGYLLTARMTAAYIDFIIRNNIDDFREVAMIGTGIHNHPPKA